MTISLRQNEGEALWFLGGLVTIKAKGEETNGRFALMEQLGPEGFGSPLHVHRMTTVAAEYGIEILGPPGIPS
jgi:hypothetical protein